MRHSPGYRWFASAARIGAGLCFAAIPTIAQNKVTVRTVVQSRSPLKPENASKPVATDYSDVVVWLKPLDRGDAEIPRAGRPAKLQLVQQHKSFQPHLLVIPVGTLVDFPNRDPFFHNVFSLFDGKRFDLGLYEAGATNSVRFDRVGASFLFCNIHPEMSAVVVAVDTPYFAISDRAGNVSIANVPDGKYELHIWYERSLPEDLKGLNRVVTVNSGTSAMGEIRVPANPGFSAEHKNKYGQDYTTPPTPGYSRP